MRRTTDFSAVAGGWQLGYNTRPPSHKMGLGMAKSKQKPGNRAAAAKAHSKSPARVAASAARKTAKPAAKAKPAPAPKKKPVKAAAKKAVAKPVPKKAPPKKAVAKKAAPARPAAKPTPAKQSKPAAVKKTASTSKPKSAAPAKPKTSPGHATEPSRNFVTTSKPEANVATKNAKARPAAQPVDSGVTMQDGRYALPTTITIDLPKGYKPSPKEEYMSPRHLQYFRTKLSKWREELVEESRQTIESLRDEVRDVGDEAERATRETENSLELRTRDRYRKLIAKIDKALKRIEEGRYGFCEETDEEIGLDRLEARPIATLSLDAQERWEHRQKQMGD